MAGELGESQISALLETVPGIASVLRSPVADALVNMIRAGAGAGTFSYADAEELVQYAVRRGLIGASEGDTLLDEVRGGARRRSSGPPASRGRSSKSVRTASRSAATRSAASAVAKTKKKAASKTKSKAASKVKKKVTRKVVKTAKKAVKKKAVKKVTRKKATSKKRK